MRKLANFLSSYQGRGSPTRRESRRSVSLDRRPPRSRSVERGTGRVCAKDRLGARQSDSQAGYEDRMGGRSSPHDGPTRGRDRLKSSVSKRVDEDNG